MQSRFLTDVVLEEGSGAVLKDVEGKKYFDFESGQVCMATGHSNPTINEAIIRQVGKLMQIGSNFTCREEILLAEALCERAPQNDPRVYLASTGSEINEAAFRLAKKATGRFEIAGVVGGYHGLTYGSWSLTTHIAGSLRGYGPIMPGAAYIPTPYCYRCPLHLKYPSCDIACADAGDDVIERQTSGRPAAFIYEVVMGAGGVIVPPPEWFHRMREICRSRGIIMIADEAQTGMGRTGTWFACQQTGVIPEVMTLSKTLGGGVALSAVIADGNIVETALSNGYSQSSSHTGDPFTAAVGLANIKLIEHERLIERAKSIGQHLAQRLQQIQGSVQILGDVRGLGSLWGIEVTKPNSREPWPEGAAAIFTLARDEGLILSLRPTKTDRRNVIRVIPPLVIGDDDLDEALEILARVVQRVNSDA